MNYSILFIDRAFPGCVTACFNTVHEWKPMFSEGIKKSWFRKYQYKEKLTLKQMTNEIGFVLGHRR